MSDMQDLATHNEDWVGLFDKYLPPVEQTPASYLTCEL
jgi:hypothetical protein